MASICPIIICQFACQRREPSGKLINQLWPIAYHVLFMQASRPSRARDHRADPIRGDPIRFDSIRSEIHSIRYGIVSCLASVTCTLDIKRRLILIIFLKKNKLAFFLPRHTLSVLGSIRFAEGNQATCSWVWLIYESSTSSTVCHLSSPLPWV